jgi:flagellar hook-associated protein 3 FlgL
MAADLQGKFNQLMGLANSTDGGGTYMFAGYRGNTAPFSLTAAGTVSYNGDQGQRLITIGATRQIPVSDSGADVFQRIKTGNGVFATGAGAGNTGTGVIDPGTVLNSNSWSASNQDFTIKFTSPTTYDIVDNVTATNIVTGATYTSGSSISFNGAQLSIQGAPATGDTFTVKASGTQDMFTTVSNLIKILNTPISGPAGQAALNNGLNTAMSNLDNGLANVLNVRASVGARMKEIDAVQSMGQDLSVQYQQVISQLQDVDYATAITDLSKKQVTLQAAQKSFATLSSLSLFQYIP